MNRTQVLVLLGSGFNRGTCVLKQDTYPSLLCPLDGRQSHRSFVLCNTSKGIGVLWLSGQVWVRVPVLTLVSLSKTLNHYCFVLWMGRKAVGPICCVMHVKELSYNLVFLAVAAECAAAPCKPLEQKGSHNSKHNSVYSVAPRVVIKSFLRTQYNYNERTQYTYR